jgi:MoxR-like ATPase
MGQGTETARRILENVKRVIVGKDSVIEQSLVALIARGHLLVEDVPGVGKTMLAKSLAISSGCTFHRIQFTPDLLPTDITGVSIYNQNTGEFQFRAGPIIGHVVLSDEINRGTPKTQSALLEAMEERQVTVDGVTHSLPGPFFVIATQNPIEYEGTFPLPEAQLDRFLLRIRLGYPGFAEELNIMDRQERVHPVDSLESVSSPDEIVTLQEDSTGIYVDRTVRAYIVTVVEASRRHSDVALGASPRASLAFMRTARALALIRGRDYVIPDDVKELAGPVLEHRIIISAGARMRGIDGSDVVADLMDKVPVPGIRKTSG